MIAGCADPVGNAARDALGPEAPNVRRGPTHRPGQPCLVCHDGSTAPEFSVAGTLYLTPSPSIAAAAPAPLVDGLVTVVDAVGASFTMQANCVGNFYAVPTSFSPTYPIRTTIRFGTESVGMISQVYRDGSCSSCHHDAPSPTSAGRVFLTDLPNPPAVRVCPP